MNRKNIIHRDLKPGNIMLNSIVEGIFDIRIADFGLSMFDNSANSNNFKICGSPGYIAPEVFKSHLYCKKSDVFSVGSILYNILSLKNLFSGKN